MACARISCSTFALALVNTTIPSSTIACTLEKQRALQGAIVGCTLYSTET
jgi:hypothetical protein